ncbi:unnamed protein product [Ascophyllum nodosum]
MKISRVVQVILSAASTCTADGSQSAPESHTSVIPRAPSIESNCSDWTAWMPPRTDPAVIMQVVTDGYVPVEKNFIAYMEKNSQFSRENIFLVCLDKGSERDIALLGFRCVPVADQSGIGRNHAFVWRMRVKVLSCLLEAGYNVIASDSDALWLKDPALDFELPEVRGSGIVSSRGDMPPELYQRWGSVLCMGFIFFRPGAGVDEVLKQINTLIQTIGDDQRSLNYVLQRMHIKWDTTTEMRYVQSTSFGRGTVPMAGLKGGGLNVTLLPHSKYTRKCDEVPIGSNTTVAHCHAKKKGPLKIEWMKRENMWEVDNLTVSGQGETQGGLSEGDMRSGSVIKSWDKFSGEN